MKKDSESFGESELHLIYIAKRLRDATRLEEILTAGGIDYSVEPEQYQGGVIFRRTRVGAFFYVLPETVERATAVMREHGCFPLSANG
ncbi:MAG TPA: hypothetical protein VFC21_12715 [Bryobacteraceae bacterium]|nr:hypothetical protein [Bryobacteraceae bacterium]